ncbi:MAG: SdrD B-like domain-containing protein, partial [Acidobacteriota bacterium]
PNTYPVGRTSITCSATDACGQSSSCTYDLVVVNAPPPPEGCRLDDFRDEVGGTPVGGFRGADLGDGRLFSPWMTEDGLEVLGLGSQLYHGPDNGGFFYLTLTDGDDLRVEVPLPEQFDFSNGTYQKGGVMLRFGLDPLAPRVMVTHVPGHPNGPSIQFDVRRAQGQTATELASTQPVADVDRLAIEKVGDEVWVEVSSDGGATWRRPLGALGGRTTLAASGPPLVGMAVASYDPINDVGFLFPEMLTCVPVDEPPPPVESAVVGQIWWDQDADGQVDDGEPALGGVAVELVDLTASVVATRITDSAGQYRFDDPEGELYGVRVGSAVDLGGPTEPTRFPDSLIAPDSYLVSVPADTVVTLDVGYRVVSGGGLGACQLDDFSDGVLDPEWSLTRFGDATVSDAAEAEGVLALSGDGSSMYVGPDHGAYLFRDADGDFRLEATVDGAGMTDGGPYEKAGLMVRPGLGGDEPRLILQLVPYWNNGPTSALQFRFRAAEGGPGDGAWASNIFGVPKQARLAIERRGDTFIAEYSLDGGATWQRPAGGAQGSVTLDWPDVVLAGLDVVSYASTPSTARFDDVELCPVSP